MQAQRGRVAAVTGAAKGIGQAVAAALAYEGARLALLDIADLGETEALVKAAGAEALTLNTDVTSPEQWQKAAAAVAKHFGKLDILVNNAGFCPFTDFASLDYATWTSLLRLNLDSAFLGAKAFAPMMIAQNWGRIVNLSSATVATESGGMTPYMAAKMGIVGLTRGLANDLGQYSVTVNAVAPSITDTPGTQVVPDEIKRQVYGRQPIPRMAAPAEIASAVLFLASDGAAMITGQTLMVSGGLVKL